MCTDKWVSKHHTKLPEIATAKNPTLMARLPAQFFMQVLPYPAAIFSHARVQPQGFAHVNHSPSQV